MPTLIALIYGRLWKVLDDEVKRIDKYYRLSNQRGCSGKSSICLDYHSFWSPLAILQAARYGHWTVELSSTGAVLASIVVPIIQNNVFIWELYSGGSLSWADSYFWQVAITHPFWSKILAILLSVNLLCSIGLLILMPGQDAGLFEDPRQITTTHEVILTRDYSSLRLDENADRQTFSDLRSELGPLTFRFRRGIGMSSMSLEASNPPIPTGWALKTWHSVEQTVGSQIPGLKLALHALWQFLHSFTNWHTDSPNFFLFRRATFLLWLLFLSSLFAFGIYLLEHEPKCSS